MKILIAGLTKIKYMPYINFYLDAIERNKNEIHVSYWNRDGKQEDLEKFNGIKFHEFIFEQTNGVNKLKKISPFVKYRKFVTKLDKQEKFDFVICLHSLSAIIAKNILKKDKYILDYRDSTFESNALFKKWISKLVLNSRITFVSSEGFKKYLPQSDKILNSHNLLLDSLNHRNYKKEKADKIRISFWGFIRHVDVNKKIIDKISLDNRFELHYYGREQEDALKLKQYVVDKGIKNVFFHGEYKPEDRYLFVKKTDLIHNLYFDRNTMLATGNKYYDGVIFRIPQLCFKDSFMGELVTRNGIGFECDYNDENFLDKIYQYYCNIKQDEFFSNCDKELERVLSEHYEGIGKIKEITSE